jgi:hypothetical protein
MKENICPYLEIDEFGDSHCHNPFDEDSPECPKEYINTCTFQGENDCHGICEQCNHMFDCESSDYGMI